MCVSPNVTMSKCRMFPRPTSLPDSVSVSAYGKHLNTAVRKDFGNEARIKQLEQVTQKKNQQQKKNWEHMKKKSQIKKNIFLRIKKREQKIDKTAKKKRNFLLREIMADL